MPLMLLSNPGLHLALLGNPRSRRTSRRGGRHHRHSKRNPTMGIAKQYIGAIKRAPSEVLSVVKHHKLKTLLFTAGGAVGTYALGGILTAQFVAPMLARFGGGAILVAACVFALGETIMVTINGIGHVQARIVDRAYRGVKIAFEQLLEAVKRGSKLYTDSAKLGVGQQTLAHVRNTLSLIGVDEGSAEALLLAGQFGNRRRGGSGLRCLQCRRRRGRAGRGLEWIGQYRLLRLLRERGRRACGQPALTDGEF
jgi:hypothetical protein